MTTSDIVILVGAIGVMLVNVVGAVFAGLAMLAASRAKLTGEENAHAIEKVHIATNGLTSRLEKAAGNTGFKAGEAGQPNPTKQ